jgi:hypothetical protein
MKKETHAYEIHEKCEGLHRELIEAGNREAAKKRGEKIRDDIGAALVEATWKNKIRRDDLRLTLARDAYEDLLAWQENLYDYNLIPWEMFVKGYKAGETNITLCGVRLVPAEWGTGWTLREKRKKGKSWQYGKSTC